MRRALFFVVIAGLLHLIAPQMSLAAEEHAVIVYLRVSASASKGDLDKLFKLEEEVASAIERAHAGEHDGNEIGGGEFTIYCYGPNGDELFAAIEPVLRKSPYSAGARVVVRYGKPGARQSERRF